MEELLVRYLVASNGRVHWIVVLGDGVIAVQDNFHECDGFKLYFNSGAEGRKQIPGWDLWILEDPRFETLEDNPKLWLKVAKEVTDASHWYTKPEVVDPIPLLVRA